MGYNTWPETWKALCAGDSSDFLTEQFLRDRADALVSSGMRDCGFRYLVIDDCWEAPERDAGGNLEADPQKFPSGMKALADYVHERGLKFGIYTCAGPWTCQNFPASYENEFRDTALFASWGVDFIKVDWCHTCGFDAKKQYTIWRDAILATKRPMILSICEWGGSKPWEWAKGVGHLWRTTGDREPTWESFLTILDAQSPLAPYAGPGHWNDPDILEVGNGTFTNEENKAQFSLWCILAAPLFAGNNLAAMSDETSRILTAREIIAVDQDPAGIQGVCVRKGEDFDIWVKPLQNRDAEKAFAVALFNRKEKSQRIPLLWRDVGFSGTMPASVRDLWQKASLGIFLSGIELHVPAHGVRMLGVLTQKDNNEKVGARVQAPKRIVRTLASAA